MTRSTSEPSTLTTLLGALLAVLLVAGAGLAFADEPVIERELHLLVGDHEPITLSFEGDLEPGESRQLTTDDGRLVVLHRDDDGLSLEIDGETIDLPDVEHVAEPGAHAYRFEIEDGEVHEHDVDIEVDGAGDGERVVITKRIVRGDGDGAPQTFVWHGDSQGAHHGAHLGDLGARLEATGALEGLDDDERQRILDALGELDAGQHQKVIVLEKDDEHEHH